MVVVAADEYERLRNLDRAQAPSFAELLLAIPQDGGEFLRLQVRPPGSRPLMYLIDTVVLSELRKPQRDARLAAWVARERTTDLFVSVVTIGEIERGIARQRATDPDFAAALATWLDRLLTLYGERVLPLDLQIARRWGQLSAALGNDSADLIGPATALERGLTVVTRNVSDFEPTGVVRRACQRVKSDGCRESSPPQNRQGDREETIDTAPRGASDNPCGA